MDAALGIAPVSGGSGQVPGPQAVIAPMYVPSHEAAVWPLWQGPTPPGQQAPLQGLPLQLVELPR